MVTNFNLAKRSIQIFSPSGGGELAMGNWTLVINRTKENDELLCYKFLTKLSEPSLRNIRLLTTSPVISHRCYGECGTRG